MGKIFTGVGCFIHGVKVTQTNCQSSGVRRVVLHLQGEVGEEKLEGAGAEEKLYLGCCGGDKVVVQQDAGPDVCLAPEDEDGPGPLPGVGHFSGPTLRTRLSGLVIHPGEGQEVEPVQTAISVLDNI